MQGLYHDCKGLLHNKTCKVYLGLMNIIVISMETIRYTIICKIQQPNYASYFCSIFIEIIFNHQSHYGCNGNMVQDIKGGTLKYSEQNG